MVRVSRGLFGSAALAWLVAVSVVAQTPAPPQAIPAEAKKMKAAFPSSPAAIEAAKPLFARVLPLLPWQHRRRRQHHGAEEHEAGQPD